MCPKSFSEGILLPTLAGSTRRPQGYKYYTHPTSTTYHDRHDPTRAAWNTSFYLAAFLPDFCSLFLRVREDLERLDLTWREIDKCGLTFGSLRSMKKGQAK